MYILIYSKLETLSSLLFAICVHIHHISSHFIGPHFSSFVFLAHIESFQVKIVHNIQGMLAFPLTMSILNNRSCIYILN